MKREQARSMAEVEFSAILSERNRIARELHDTIAQNLNAVSIQLELARNRVPLSTNPQNASHAEMAHRIVRHTITELRESIWNMRSHILEKTDLIGALRTLVDLLGVSATALITVRTEGTPRRLASLIENNLLRIGQEMLSNTLNHSGSTELELVLIFEPRSVCLCAKDNGRGFDTSIVDTGRSGYGLRGMRERAEQISAELHISSQPGVGTTIKVRVPLPD
jgi:signal transduction histidine kinase